MTDALAAQTGELVGVVTHRIRVGRNERPEDAPERVPGTRGRKPRGRRAHPQRDTRAGDERGVTLEQNSHAEVVGSHSRPVLRIGGDALGVGAQNPGELPVVRRDDHRASHPVVEVEGTPVQHRRQCLGQGIRHGCDVAIDRGPFPSPSSQACTRPAQVTASGRLASTSWAGTQGPR